MSVPCGRAPPIPFFFPPCHLPSVHSSSDPIPWSPCVKSMCVCICGPVGKGPRWYGVDGVPQDRRRSHSHWKPHGRVEPWPGNRDLPFSSGLRSLRTPGQSPPLLVSVSQLYQEGLDAELRKRALSVDRAPCTLLAGWGVGRGHVVLRPPPPAWRAAGSGGSTHLAIYHHPQPWQRIAGPRAGLGARRGRSPRPARGPGGRPAAGLMARPPVLAAPGAPRPPPPAPLPLSAPRCAAGRSGPAARFRPGSRAPTGWAGRAAAPPRRAPPAAGVRGRPRRARAPGSARGRARPPSHGQRWVDPTEATGLRVAVARTRGLCGPADSACTGAASRRRPRRARRTAGPTRRPRPLGPRAIPNARGRGAVGRWAGLAWRPGDLGISEYTALSFCPGPHT